MRIFLEPIGVVRGRLCPQSVEIDVDSAVGKLIESLNLPPKLNVIAITDGKRMSLDEKLKDGATVKIVSLALGG
ncbi:MAG: hypothetical protein ACYDHG_02650 [Desulfomonilaceae bacterium]